MRKEQSKLDSEQIQWQLVAASFYFQEYKYHPSGVSITKGSSKIPPTETDTKFDSKITTVINH